MLPTSWKARWNLAQPAVVRSHLKRPVVVAAKGLSPRPELEITDRRQVCTYIQENSFDESGADQTQSKQVNKPLSDPSLEVLMRLLLLHAYLGGDGFDTDRAIQSRYEIH